jgi:hypothetical protein
MEVQYSLVSNSIGGGLNSLVMRAWYIDEDDNQVTIKSCVKTDLDLPTCLQMMASFIEEVTQEQNG